MPNVEHVFWGFPAWVESDVFVHIVSRDVALAKRLCSTLGLSRVTHGSSLEAITVPPGRAVDLAVIHVDDRGRTWRDLGAAPSTKVVAIIEHEDDAATALEAGVYDVVVAPIDTAANHARLRHIVQRAAEEYALHCALDLVGITFEVSTANHRIARVGGAFERLTGYSAAEAVGRTPRDLLKSAETNPGALAEAERLLESGYAWHGGLVSHTKSGALFTQLASAAPVLGVDRSIVAVRRETTREQAAASFTRVLMESAIDAIVVADFETGIFVDANAAACAAFGYSRDELRALDFPKLVASGSEAIVAELTAALMNSGRATRDAMRMKRKDDAEFWADLRIAAFDSAGTRLYAAFFRDVTERVTRQEELERSHGKLREAQAQLAHASKLAALGHLAAGVAHEVNNPATYVALNLAELQERLPDELSKPSDEIDQLVAESLDGIWRIANIVGDLRLFSRVEEPDRTATDLRDVARVALRMAGNELRHHAKVETQLGEVPSIEAHAGRLVQVVINLLVNAAHALTVSSGLGTVAVRTFTRNEWVAIEVEDDGPGISESDQAHLFDPFFTTKTDAQGTGLGLSLSRQIVEAHDGRIEVDSAVGRGARFTVLLPVRSHETTASSPAKVASVVPRARSRVLVVDDDPLVRNAICRALRADFDVVSADGGPTALVLVQGEHEFDLIVCDLMMPGMDGPAFYKECLEFQPELATRFLFCSGGVLGENNRHFLATVHPPLLQKPASVDDIRRAVNACLDGEGWPERP